MTRMTRLTFDAPSSLAVARITACGVLVIWLAQLLSTTVAGDDDAEHERGDAEPCAGIETKSEEHLRAFSGDYHCPAVKYGDIDDVWWYDVWKKDTCFGGTIDGVPYYSELPVCIGPVSLPNPNCEIPADFTLLTRRQRGRIQRKKVDAGAEFHLADSKGGSVTSVEYNGYAKLRHFHDDYFFKLFTLIHRRGNGPTTVRHCGVQCNHPLDYKLAEFNREQGSISEFEHFIDVRFQDGDLGFDVTFHVTSDDPL
ncbi:MAG: hypothetical protein AB7U20_04430 [Planctomycetaceae bacterium]